MGLKKKINESLKDADIKELVFKSSSFFLVKIFGILSGYIFTLFIARIFGAEVNGLITICYTIFLIGSLIPRFGFDINLIKTFSSKTIEESKYIYLNVLKASLLVGLVFFTIGYFLKNYLAEVFKASPDYILFGVISIPIWTVILINAAVLRGLKETNKSSFLHHTARFLFAVFILIILYFIFGYKGKFSPGLSHTMSLVLLLFLSCYFVWKKIHNVRKEKGDFILKTYINKSLPLMFSAGLILFLGWTDTIFLGIYTSPEKVGVYNVSLKIATIIGLSLQSLDSILAPQIAKSYSLNDRNTFDKLIKLAVKINFYFALFMTIILVVFRKFILEFFGPEFVTGSGIMAILCIGQFINALCGPVGVIFQMTGYQKIFQNLTFIAFIINFIIDLFAIKHYGYYGAAVSSIISISVWNILGVIIARKKFNIKLIYFPVKLEKKA